MEKGNTVGETAKMFIARVALGNAHVTTKGTKKEFVKDPPVRRPPDVNGHLDGDPLQDPTAEKHDSLVFDGPNAPDKKNYREFMVYDRNLCYPEFIVEYQRT